MASTALMVLSGIGTVATAYSQSKSGDAQAAVSQYNASVARNQAIASRQSAAFEATKQRDYTRKLLAKSRARAGASGLGFEGSPMTVMENTAREAELDARAIEYGGELEAMGYESRAALSDWEAKQLKRAAKTSAITTLLSGASKLFGGFAGSPLSGGSQTATDLTRYSQLMAVK